jgi:hypothetical protein
MCSISDCPERVLLDSLSDPIWYGSGYAAYDYFLPIFAKNNWALVKQLPRQNGRLKTIVTKRGTVMDIWCSTREFHATVDEIEDGYHLHSWHLHWGRSRRWIKTTYIDNKSNYRDWIDSLVKFIKG